METENLKHSFSSLTHSQGLTLWQYRKSKVLNAKHGCCPVLEVREVIHIVMSSEWAHKQLHFGWPAGLHCRPFRCCSSCFVCRCFWSIPDWVQDRADLRTTGPSNYLSSNNRTLQHFEHMLLMLAGIGCQTGIFLFCLPSKHKPICTHRGNVKARTAQNSLL